MVEPITCNLPFMQWRFVSVCNFHSTEINTVMRQRQIISEDDLALADRFVLEDRSGPELNDNKRKPRQEIDRL
jgi:hypothetical protein